MIDENSTAVFSVRITGFCCKCGKTLRPGQEAVVHKLRYFHFECYDALIDEGDTPASTGNIKQPSEDRGRK